MKLNAATRLRARRILPQSKGVKIPKAAQQVLVKMANTVVAQDPGHETPGTYTDKSCYGKVAHALRQVWARAHLDEPNWYILLFSSGTDTSNVAHACLYTQTGVKVVDTFPGKPVNREGQVLYEVPGVDINSYPLMLCLTVTKFARMFIPDAV